MDKRKVKVLITLLFTYFILIGVTIFIGYSNQDISEVVIKSMNPVYDSESGVVINSDGVIFNDKNQQVKYNVVIENTQDYDVKVTDIRLSTPSEKFLEYKIEGISDSDVLKSNGTKELIITFETKEIDGWGRNFEDELITDIYFVKVAKEDVAPVLKPVEKPNENIGNSNGNSVIQPDVEVEPELPVEGENAIDDALEDSTQEESSMETVCECENNNCLLWKVIAIVGIIVAIILVVLLIKTKQTKLLLLLLGLTSIFSIVSAEELINLAIKIKVSYQSQNVMKASGWEFDEDGNPVTMGTDYWDFNLAQQIVNFNIQNELVGISDYDYVFDVSEAQNERVMAYLVKNNDNMVCTNEEGEEEQCYDLYLQADGIIYANQNATGYFAMMINLHEILNLEGLSTQNVTNMSYMFGACAEKDASRLDFSKLDTSNVTNMSAMFVSMGYNSANLNLDLSNFNTSNVTDMSHMFDSMGSESVTLSLDVSNFDTSKVTDMSYMFQGVGYNSVDLNTSITIKNPNITSYTNIFSGVATKDGSKFIVNYTSETSELVDQMIATKSNNSNVIKGKNVTSEYNVEVVSGTGKNIGDEIKIANESFYVIYSDNDVTNLISKYNLEVGNDCEVNLKADTHSCISIENPSGIQNSKAKGVLLDENLSMVTEDYGAVTFSNSSYWGASYGSTYPKYVYNEQSNIYNYLVNYQNYLSNSGLVVLDGGLISVEELNELGCDVSSGTCLASPYSWLYSTSYWTGSAADSNSLYNVYNIGYILTSTSSVDYGGGVRPVITIPTSELL